MTVAIIAVSTAFLVGTTLLLLTVGTQFAAITGDVSTSTTATYHDSVADAENATGDGAIVFPVAIVDDESGTEHTVIGIPADAPRELDDASTGPNEATIPPPGESQTLSGPSSEDQTVQFAGQQGEITATVTPHDEDTLFPSWWYTAESSTVETLGPTEAIAIETSGEITDEEPTIFNLEQFDTGVPLVSAHAFLLTGMSEVLQVLAVATGAGAVVIMVVLYSVTRISVWERLETLAIIRSTGGTPLSVLSLFGIRSTLLALVGVFGGFLIGSITPPLVVALASWAGLSVTLEPRLTWPILRVLIPMLTVLVVVGALAGVLAARPAVTVAPTALQGLSGQRQTSSLVHQLTTCVPSSLSPTLLDWRTLIPTGATLTVFILLVLLIGGIGAAAAPLDTTETGTVTSADASHPIDSRLDIETADAFRAEGIDASPELMIGQVNDGESYLARGANYSDFAAVTDAELIDGHEPAAPDEAVIGSSLAETQDVSIGETRMLGGSDRPGVSQVTIVGVYETDSMADDQLIVPLETGHELALDTGTVHVIRTAGDADAALGSPDESTGIIDTVFDTRDGSEDTTDAEMVQEVRAPETAASDESVPISVYLRNDESAAVTETLEIEAGDQTVEREVTLEPNKEAQIEINHTFDSTGSQTVAVGDHSQNITVLAPDTLVFPETLPAEAPPGETLLVPVTTPDDDPVSDATVSLDGVQATTNDDGIAQIELPETEGEYELSATQADQDSVSHEIEVIDGQQRLFGADLEITPQTGTPSTAPETTVTLMNHWMEGQTQEIQVNSPADEQTETVTLAPGESMSTDRTVGDGDAKQEIPPGEYQIEMTADEEPIATETYEVLDGDFDLESIAGDAQYQSGAAMGQLIDQTLGNMQVLFGTMIILAGLMTVGSTTAVFAQAVHARRKAIAIHRSTGARPIRVLRIIVLDACKLAIPAVLLAAIGALLTLFLLRAVGLLSVFGIQLTTDLSPVLVLLTLLGAVAIAVCSAVLAVLPALRSSPTAVWHGTPDEKDSRKSNNDTLSDEQL
ncbi:ABC transporter permease [Halalkalicoccus tibetensis]|uniref:FtsX-like permease family protein n=1 Tax=Halalkalicoccus tibetensis TaxID=175632 RepID=A0ABD5V8G8_9EURY